MRPSGIGNGDLGAANSRSFASLRMTRVCHRGLQPSTRCPQPSTRTRMRLFAIPATIVGVAIAIVFFKLYGMLTRPDVPRPIAIIVDQFAPGVQIGASIYDARHAVAGMTYVPHLGF